KDTFGVMVFLGLFAIVLFFMPEFGGYFLEYNNFVPADPLKTPSHIAPVWYFTPYYSILRATTADFMLVLAAAALAMGFLIVRSDLRDRTKAAALGMVAVLLVGFYFIDAKVWGVVLMGLAVMIFFLLPWLDVSPVKSMRYKGPLFKTALAVFVIAFLVLGFFGTQPVTKEGTFISQFFTIVYFGFFALMPWYSRMDKTKPVPERVTE
ncbi:MAG TPA: cytochrome bc complex cytochrome b subunit, partial [Burkholderiales bacterium]|nr:cytochrome bc complex cytochrome b subunit [Burkholderiales bacterium]